MGRFIWVVALLSVILLLTGIGMRKKQAPVPEENAQIIAFSYSHTGSSTYEIYSFDVARDEDTGTMTVNYDLMCGNEKYSVPAEHAFLLDLSTLIEEHDLRAWDGFDKSVSGVLDGDGFDLTIRYEDGTKISASGRNCSPDGHNDAARAINDLFHDYLKKQGVDPQAE